MNKKGLHEEKSKAIEVSEVENEEEKLKLLSKINELQGEIEIEVKNIVDKMMVDQSNEERELAYKAFKEMLITGASPAKALKIDDSLLNFCYSKGYNLYNLGQYKEALKMFELLINLEPNSPRYVLGLASCFYMLKDYVNAVKNYTRLVELEPESPFPFYFMINCCEAMGMKSTMVDAIVACIKLCHRDPEYAQMEDRCHLMLDGLVKELGIKKEELGLPLVQKDEKKVNSPKK